MSLFWLSIVSVASCLFFLVCVSGHCIWNICENKLRPRMLVSCTREVLFSSAACLQVLPTQDWLKLWRIEIPWTTQITENWDGSQWSAGDLVYLEGVALWGPSIEWAWFTSTWLPWWSHQALFECYQYAYESQTYIFSTALFLGLHIPKCLLIIPIWMSMGTSN